MMLCSLTVIFPNETACILVFTLVKTTNRQAHCVIEMKDIDKM